MFDISSLTDNPINLAILVGAFLIIIYIVFKVAKSILQLILIAGVVGLAYFFWQGGTVDELKDSGVEVIFKDANLSNMKVVLCSDSNSDKAKCTCIVDPVYEDIHNRLSKTEIARINTSPEEIKEELRKSMKSQRKDIRKCLLSNQGDKLIDNVRGLLDS